MTNLTIYNGQNSQLITLTGLVDQTGAPVSGASITANIVRSGNTRELRYDVRGGEWDPGKLLGYPQRLRRACGGSPARCEWVEWRSDVQLFGVCHDRESVIVSAAWQPDYYVGMAEHTNLESKYAAEQQRIRDVVQEMVPGADVLFDTRFKPEAIAFTITDESGQRIGHFPGGTAVTELELMTSVEIADRIRESL